jgi:DNA-binding PadR family transcriptional regulator
MSLQEKYLERMRLVLRELSKGALSRRTLESRFTHRFESPAAFESTFMFLLRDGRVTKSGTQHRAPYSITDRGRKMLEGLS